jgi:hypothetical protein
MHRSAIALLMLICSTVSAESTPRERPQIEGEWWQIVGSPDLGPLTSPKQQPVDFAVWRAADGTWQLWSCIRGTKEPGKTRLFYRWEGAAIDKPNWTPKGIAMHADASLGETPGGLQAPYVFRPSPDKPFHMLYGDWSHICLATSDDGKTFTRQPLNGRSGRFGEGENDNARDPFAIRIGDLWYVYYTAHPNRRGATYCRTTRDFETFSAAKVVARGGVAGQHASSAECPQVIRRGQWFYLFRTVNYTHEPLTHVYASKDPLAFGVDDDRCQIGTLPIAAPEFVQDADREFVAALMPDLKGIRVAKLKWVAD